MLFIGMPTEFMQLNCRHVHGLKVTIQNLGDGNQYAPVMEIDLCANFTLHRHNT